MITKELEYKIKEFCLNNNITSYFINMDGSIDVHQNVSIVNGIVNNELPISFGTVKGNFTISSSNINTLKGSPKWVSGNFDCTYNGLRSLKYAPKMALGTFDCSHNSITSLEHCPTEVGQFLANHNFLDNLEHLSTNIHGTLGLNNNYLSSLIGCPKELNGDLYCGFNNLTTLEGIPEEINGSFFCNNNRLKRFDHSWCGSNLINASINPIETFVGMPKVDLLIFDSNTMIPLYNEIFALGYTLSEFVYHNDGEFKRMKALYRRFTINNIINN